MKNKIAIVTGATSGIGKAMVMKLAKRKTRMILTARNEESLQEVAKEADRVAGAGISGIVFGDIANEWVTTTCIKNCFDYWNEPPDIFIACAGRGLPGTVIDSDPEEWDSLINTNIKGLWWQLKAIGKTMLERASVERNFVQDPLDIVVIGSSIGRNVSPFNSIYGATKFAAHGATEALRRQLGPLGIRVTLIEPGLVDTNFQKSAGYNLQWFEGYKKEVGPIIQADDVALIIDFLLQLPGNINLDNISIRPTRQAYP